MNSPLGGDVLPLAVALQVHISLLDSNRERQNVSKTFPYDGNKKRKMRRQHNFVVTIPGITGLMAAGSGTGVTQPPSASSESGFSEDGEGEGHSSGTNDDEITPNNQGHYLCISKVFHVCFIQISSIKTRKLI